MKIGFYGDSFCCEVTNPHSLVKGYDTYIKKLKNHFDADIVHLGVGGSSIWDVILQQFTIDNAPDVCIFVWTDPSRLYNKNLRNLTMTSLENKIWKDYSLKDITYRRTINAAKEYFKHLYDYDKARIESIAAMQYFDTNVLSIVNSKIVHLWSFEEQYRWKHGTIIDTPLNSFVQKDQQGLDLWAANHINGDAQNENVFHLIKEII
jgi:hypothetical protein